MGNETRVNLKHLLEDIRDAYTSPLEYHVLVTVASVLSKFLESEKSPQEFLNRLLTAWALQTEKDKAGKLF